MKVDLPIMILFDCQETSWQAIERGHTAICTLRFDTDTVGDNAEVFVGYPPKNERFGEEAECILGMLSNDQWVALRKKLERWPYDYCTDEAEGKRRQEEVDEEIAQDSHFGAGA